MSTPSTPQITHNQWPDDVVSRIRQYRWRGNTYPTLTIEDIRDLIVQHQQKYLPDLVLFTLDLSAKRLITDSMLRKNIDYWTIKGSDNLRLSIPATLILIANNPNPQTTHIFHSIANWLSLPKK